MGIVRLFIVALAILTMGSCAKFDTDEAALSVVYEDTELKSLTVEALIPVPGRANHMGKTYPSAEALDRVFTITNSATQAFTLIGDEPVSIVNGSFNDFRIIAQPAVNTLQPGDTASFVVSFRPTAQGERYSNIVFHYRDGDDEVEDEDLPMQEMKAFFMTIGGTSSGNGLLTLRSDASNSSIPSGSEPSKALGTWFSNEGAAEFPTVSLGTEIPRRFFLFNESETEVLDLIGSRISFEGNPTHFELNAPTDAVVNPGGVIQFTVTYKPTRAGAHFAYLTISSSATNAPDTGYRIRLGGETEEPDVGGTSLDLGTGGVEGTDHGFGPIIEEEEDVSSELQING